MPNISNTSQNSLYKKNIEHIIKLLHSKILNRLAETKYICSFKIKIDIKLSSHHIQQQLKDHYFEKRIDQNVSN